MLEGRVGRSYTLQVRTPRRVQAVEGITLTPEPGGYRLQVRFEGEGTGYVRRELRLPLE
ncbi:hypothetical protein [Rhodothermus marinus]|uniref:hypothetical protein n=1 Tax=Rhodothermus marinus TaxID=29549 RepID=UPI000A7B6A7D|nr:hypothetical protein [Rhodothermus marinus]